MNINTNLIIMNKKTNIILILIVSLTLGCSNESVSNLEESIDEERSSFNGEQSFLPMHIGNYWKNDKNNYVEIIDTLRIQGDLYYKFYRLMGGDSRYISYMRIDSNQNLIESFPDDPDFKYTHAKFDAQIGSTFWTLNDQSVNDLKVTVIVKDSSLRTFELQRSYHTNINAKAIKTYIKGLGYNIYDEVRINGEVFNP
jgi:hypothetical protein